MRTNPHLPPNQNILVDMARRMGLPPCILARKILSFHLEDLHSPFNNGNINHGNNHNQNVTNHNHNIDVTRDMKVRINQCFNNPAEITDLHLRREIEACIILDDLLSPLVARLKKSLSLPSSLFSLPSLLADLRICCSTVGLEYEYRLKSFLYNLGIPFMGEEEQRHKGQSKTPDVRLPIPLG